MATVTVSTVIEQPIAVVWDDIRRLDTHIKWMADAEAIRFLTDDRAGVGTRFECDTKVGPLRTTDVMEVTDWVEGERIGVRHQGLVPRTTCFELALPQLTFDTVIVQRVADGPVQQCRTEG